MITPGPWELTKVLEPGDWPGVDGDGGNFSVIVYGEPEEDQVGVQGRTLQEAYANARLIASAPELLEALELFIEYDNDDDDAGVSMMLSYSTAINAARAAIAKARGEA